MGVPAGDSCVRDSHVRCDAGSLGATPDRSWPPTRTGFFRTELMTPQSTQYAEASIEDYADRTRQTVEAWKGMDGKQSGDPAKLAAALVQLAALENPPARFAAGADAVELFETKAHTPLGPGQRTPRTVLRSRAPRRLTLVPSRPLSPATKR